MRRRGVSLQPETRARPGQTRTPSIPSPATTSRPLELLHLDVVGELPVDGSGGERYFLTVLDDFSHRCEALAGRNLSRKGLNPLGPP